MPFVMTITKSDQWAIQKVMKKAFVVMIMGREKKPFLPGDVSALLETEGCLMEVAEPGWKQGLHQILWLQGIP